MTAPAHAIRNVNGGMMPVEGQPLSSQATRRGPSSARLDGRAPLYSLSSAPPGGKSLDMHKIEAAYVGYHKDFHDRLMTAESIYRRLASVVETDQVVDTQLWLSQNPAMRPWIGPKVLNKYRAESHEIRTKPHEASVMVPKKDIQNDRYGLFRPRINSLADTYGRALDKLSIAMLVAGVQGTALGTTYDGENLIDTDHTALSTGGTSQSNKVTGALSSTTYNEARTKLRRLKNENDEPINQGKRTTLVVGPQNEGIAREILEQDFQANGERNMDANRSALLVTDWLDNTALTVYGASGPTTVTPTGLEWFLLVEGGAPVLIHVKQGPEFLSVEEGEFVFMNAIYLYGVEAEFGAGYGLWQEIAGGPGA